MSLNHLEESDKTTDATEGAGLNARAFPRAGTSAVDHISIEVEPGEAMGIGGLNGASKTAEPFGPERFVSFFRLRASKFDLGTVSRFTNNFGRSSDRI